LFFKAFAVFGGESVWTQGHLEVVSFDFFQPGNLHDPNCALKQNNNALYTRKLDNTQQKAFRRRRGGLQMHLLEG